MITEEMMKEILTNEEFVSQIVKQRNPSETSAWWKSTLATSVITALVTAIITITGSYVAQSSIKNKEISQARFEYEQNKKREFITRVWELIADAQRAGEDRLVLAKSKYDAFKKARRDAITATTNISDANWRTERDPTESFIYLHYNNREDIINAWQQLRSALQEYCDCAENTYNKFNGSKAPIDSCVGEYKKYSDAKIQFRSLIIDEYRSSMPSN